VQDHFSAQVVTHLDVFLVFVGSAVDLIITLGLEEKMPGLAADHGHQPADQRGFHRVYEHGHVGNDETDRTQEMQGLIDAAVVIETMIIPSLGLEFRPEAAHRGSSRIAM